MRSFTFLLLFTIGFTGLLATNYTIDKAYSIRFSTEGAEGTFRGLSGTIDYDPENPAAGRFDVSVPVETISTGNGAKDKHARGSSWFDGDDHPQITFKSELIRETKTGLEVIGDLQMAGRTRSVTIPFTFEAGTPAVFVGEFSVDRKNFGINGPLLFGGLVGRQVAVTLRIPVVSE